MTDEEEADEKPKSTAPQASKKESVAVDERETTKDRQPAESKKSVKESKASS